jgi:chemotaxis protein MotB
MPTLTRTGEVKDVIIRENVEPTFVTVNAGDEVRWTNKRQAVVRVIFLNPMTENLSCQRNFGGTLGFGTKRTQYTAKLRPNKTASVCFREPGEVRYVVRAESTDFGGEQNFAGTIAIGPEYQARATGIPATDKNERQVASADKGQAESSDMSARLAEKERERQRLVDELAISRSRLADRDAIVASLRNELDHSMAVQLDLQQTASEITGRLADGERDRQVLADELAATHRQLTARDADVANLRHQLDQSLAVQHAKEQTASETSWRLAAKDREGQHLADELVVVQMKLADRDAGLAALRKQLEEHTRKLAEKDLLAALQREISKGTVVVQQSDDALTINLASSLLFDSGQDRMKAGAMGALKRVGNVLKDFPDKQVHVVGYTDNIAIKGDLQKKFASNKELSDARANRAAQALRDGGVHGNLLADGYGDSNPIATNTTAGGRARNRRVEIIITS